MFRLDYASSEINYYSGNTLERLDTISMSDGDHKLEIEMTLKIEDFDTVI